MENTLKTLAVHLETIILAIELGWEKGQRWIQTCEGFLSKAVRSDIINEFIFNEARRLFSMEQCVGDRNSLRGLKFVDIFIKLKKLNKRFLPYNIKTKQITRFHHQLPLPGIGNTQNLVVGWRHDPTGTKITGIYLVKTKSNNELEWRVDIRQYLNDKSTGLQPLTAPTAAPAPVPVAVPKVKESALIRRNKKISNG